MKNKKNIIGTGSFGCDLAHYLHRQNYPGEYIYICDEQDYPEYGQSGYPHRHFNHAVAGSHNSAHLMQQFEDEIKPDFSGKTEYILSCDCESEADFQMAKAIISKLKECNCSFKVFLHYPFYAAGDKKLSRLQALENLIEKPDNLIKIDREIYEKYREMKFNDAFEAIFGEMMEKV